MHAADLELPSPVLTEHMLQEDTIMGGAGSARPAEPQSDSSEDSEPEVESGNTLPTVHVSCCCLVAAALLYQPAQVGRSKHLL